MRTQVKILQHNRLDANSLVSAKLSKQTKTAPLFLRGLIKNVAMEVFLRDGQHRDFLELVS